jgi:hypothetical protein
LVQGGVIGVVRGRAGDQDIVGGAAIERIDIKPRWGYPSMPVGAYSLPAAKSDFSDFCALDRPKHQRFSNRLHPPLVGDKSLGPSTRIERVVFCLLRLSSIVLHPLAFTLSFSIRLRPFIPLPSELEAFTPDDTSPGAKMKSSCVHVEICVMSVVTDKIVVSNT